GSPQHQNVGGGPAVGGGGNPPARTAVVLEARDAGQCPHRVQRHGWGVLRVGWLDMHRTSIERTYDSCPQPGARRQPTGERWADQMVKSGAGATRPERKGCNCFLRSADLVEILSAR